MIMMQSEKMVDDRGNSSGVTQQPLSPDVRDLYSFELKAFVKHLIVVACLLPVAFAEGQNTCHSETQFLVEHENGSTSCEDCPSCPPGQTLLIECGKRVQSSTMIGCKSCKPGVSFSSKYGVSICTPCSSCAKDQVVLQNCTVTQDIKCDQRCYSNDRYYDDDKGDCFPCTKCCYDEQDVVENECKEKLGTGSKKICSFHSNINRCDKSPPFPPETSTTTKVTTVGINSSQGGSKREHTVPPTAQPSHRFSPSKATEHQGLLIAVIISLTLILLVILLISAVCLYSHRTSDMHHKPAKGTLGMVEEGLEMSDIVNHGRLPTESMEPLVLLTEDNEKEMACSCQKESKLLSSLLDDEPSLQTISEWLDAPLKGAGSYRAVAQTYGFNHCKIQSVLKTDVRGPTTALIESLAATHPKLTVQEFAVAVRVKAKRKDVALLLEAYDSKEISGNE